jgi:GDSL-like Lipase/Acylhydrolase family
VSSSKGSPTPKGSPHGSRQGSEIPVTLSSMSYAYNNAAFVYSGGWLVTTHTDTASTSRACLNQDRYYAEVAFSFTGSELDMFCAYGTGATVKYRLDGGPWVTIPGNGNVWGTLVIVSGLPDVQHWIQIKGGSSNTNNNTAASGFQLDASVASNAFTVVGSAPSVAKPSSSAPYGFEVFSGSIYWIADTTEGTTFVSGSPGAPYVFLEDAAAAFSTGQWTNTGTVAHNNALGLTIGNHYTGREVAVRFTAQCSEIWIYASVGSTWALRCGDTMVGTGNAVQQVGVDYSEGVWCKLAANLSAVYPVEYTLTSEGTIAPVAYLFAISLVAPSGATFTTNVPAARPLLGALGDSFTDYGAINLPGSGYARALSQSLGYGLILRGINGTTIRDFTGTPGLVANTAYQSLCISNRVSDITAITPAPPVVAIVGGTNDLFHSTENSGVSGIYLGAALGNVITGGTVNFTVAQFQSSYSAMIASLVAGLPSAIILCCSITPKNTDGTQFNGSGQTNTAWKAQFNAAIQAAVLSAANTNVRFVDIVNTPIGVFTPTFPGDTLEGWHPAPSGSRKIASSQYRALQPPAKMVNLGALNSLI